MHLHGLNLFPLDLIQQRLIGYYLHADGSVYSNKARKGSLTKLGGSKTISGQYYTLGGCTYRADSLTRQARAHIKWGSETLPLTESDSILDRIRDRARAEASRKVSPVSPSAVPANRSYSQSMAGAVKDHAVLIASIIDNSLIFGTKPKLHNVEASWKDEMKRLALAAPGVKFVALQIVSAVQVEGLKWE